ncbi:hypothetical protein DFJ74DRAFT_686619 [Hyaloraphidium curvatum]|nr:hypothetical protein DFJ74DRAFT_686619 [Hyaloraphidium curvatum]
MLAEDRGRTTRSGPWRRAQRVLVCWTRLARAPPCSAAAASRSVSLNARQLRVHFLVRGKQTALGSSPVPRPRTHGAGLPGPPPPPDGKRRIPLAGAKRLQEQQNRLFSAAGIRTRAACVKDAVVGWLSGRRRFGREGRRLVSGGRIASRRSGRGKARAQRMRHWLRMISHPFLWCGSVVLSTSRPSGAGLADGAATRSDANARVPSIKQKDPSASGWV